MRLQHCIAMVGTTALVGCVAAGDSEDGPIGAAEDAMSAANAAVYIQISEFRPGPTTGASAGFVEILNTANASADVSGWAIDDQANGGATPKAIHAGTVLGAGARLSIPFAGINWTSADRVRLLDASGHEVDAQSNFYTGTSIKGQCFARDDATSAWSRYAVPCTPGAPNGAITPLRPSVVINEVKAGSSGYVEIVNRSSGAVDLTGYRVDDTGLGSAAKTIAAGTVLASGAVLKVPYAGVNTSSIDLVRLLDASGDELDRQANGYAGASIAGLCFGRIPDGGGWASGAIACSAGALNGYGAASPVPPAALQWIGAFASATGPVSALDLSRDGTYTATVNGARQHGAFTATAAAVFTMDGGASGVAWTATADPWSGALTVDVGAAQATLTGYAPTEDACDTTGGGWTDDDVDAPTGLYCICPPSQLLIWSAGGCTN